MFLEIMRKGGKVISASLVKNLFVNKTHSNSGQTACYLEVTKDNKDTILKILEDPTKLKLGSMKSDSDVAFVDMYATGFDASECGSRKLATVDTTVRVARRRAGATSFFKNL